MLLLLSAAFAYDYGLVAYYPFDDSDADLSANGHDADLRSGAGYDTLARCGSHSLFLDNPQNNDDEYVQLPDEVAEGLDDFSVSTWFRADSTSDWERIFDFGDRSNDRDGVYFVTAQHGRQGDRIGATVHQASSTYEESTTSCPSAADGTWYHIAFVYDADGGWTFYVDGTTCGSGTMQARTLGTLDDEEQGDVRLYIGRSNWTDPRFNGRIDEFRIYDFPLTAAHVTRLADPGRTCGPFLDADEDGLLDDEDPCFGLDNGNDQDTDGYCADTDCDDDDPGANPGAVDIPGDLVDQDCSGTIACYTDDDGDGAGISTPVDDDGDGMCDDPGEAMLANDCDDEDDERYPAFDFSTGAGIGDGKDNDCSLDGEDECYRDLDNDGFGDWAVIETSLDDACDDDQESADTTDPDCDDTAPGVYPRAVETLCTGADDNCDGIIDNVLNPPSWFHDGDLDGHGDPDDEVEQCTAPALGTWLTSSDDCNDSNPTINPSEDEVCDAIDHDCVDGPYNGVTLYTHYADQDSDGFGAGSSQESCAVPAGRVQNFSDCDDLVATTYPGAPELCNGVDDNCVGGIDEVGDITWYEDEDGDGYALDGAATQVSCSDPGPTWVTLTGDCNDEDVSIRPDQAERCNGVDDDCDGATDENDLPLDPSEGGLYYLDGDDDGWGTGAAVRACVQPTGHASTPGDCDDGDTAQHPTAMELCNGEDDDCDNQVDEYDPSQPPTNGTPFYFDGDDDLHGDPHVFVTACEAPPDHVANDGDCDDGDATIHDDRVEYCDGIDNDCDGDVDNADANVVGGVYYPDTDGDGFGAGDAVACEVSGYATNAQDCDDTDPLSYPGALPICDGQDHDCDGDPDGVATWRDVDQDGFGDRDAPILDCTDTTGVTNDADCDDRDRTTYPDASPVCDGQDHDCDGVPDGEANHIDADGDGYGDPDTTTTVCDEGVSDASDCDDTTDAINPGVTEIPGDGIDNDCDPNTPDITSPTDTGDTADTGPTGDVVLPRPTGGCGCDQPGGVPWFFGFIGLLAVRRRAS